MTAKPLHNIAPSQILYLEHGSNRLYAEAIQIVEARQLCWVRPTLLIQDLPYKQKDTQTLDAQNLADRQAAIATAAASPESSSLSFYDLDDCPDLIWPIAFFSVAFDIDFFALLIQLKHRSNVSVQDHPQRRLSEFVRSFWLAHKDAF